MAGEPADHSLSRPPLPGDRLSAAFRLHGSSTGRNWTVIVRRKDGAEAGVAEDDLCVRVDLTARDADVLADVLEEMAELAADPNGRGASRLFIGSAEAARLVDVKPSTIRAWVAGRGPARHPFPRPVIPMPGRNLWVRKAVEKWKAEQDVLDQQESEPGD